MVIYMNNKEYEKFIKKYTPKPPVLMNAIVTFVGGGVLGLTSELLLEIYQIFCNITFFKEKFCKH